MYKGEACCAPQACCPEWSARFCHPPPLARRHPRLCLQLSHEHIVTLLDVFRQGGKLYLCFEYLEKTGAGSGQGAASFPSRQGSTSCAAQLHLVRALHACIAAMVHRLLIMSVS